VVNDYDSYSDSDEEVSTSSRETRDVKNVDADGFGDEDAVMFADAGGGVSDQIVLVTIF
jgi:hypothetical protein